MKVLLAIKSLSLPGGGAERILADLAGYLVEHRNDVSLLTFDQPDSADFYRVNKKVKRLYLGIGDVRKKAGLDETIARIRAMRRIVKSEQPDVSVGFMHSMYVPLALSHLATGIPVIASEHNVPENFASRGVEFPLMLLSTLWVKRITLISESIHNSYPWLVRRKAVVIPNPVREIKTGSKKSRKAQARKFVLSVGRLEPQKDHATLVKAFAQITDEFPNWDLRIIGEGSLRPQLETQIQSLGLESRIALPGATEEIDKEFAHAEIFALPSLYESFGLATAEAMSHGLPVVGFADCPGTNELVQHQENGLLVGSSDRVANFAKGLATLMRDRALRKRLGAKGGEMVEQFAPERIFAMWERVLRKAVKV